jgi:DNA primase
LAIVIPESAILEIKNTADIVDIISEFVLLKKAGKNFVGLCPFHAEKTPSFTVSPEKQIFYCFGCGAGGNIFSFLMKHNGLLFPEAVKMIAARYGIEIPDQKLPPLQEKRISERESLLDINRKAMVFFSKVLLNGSEGKRAMIYLKKRGIQEKTIHRFSLGYAPPGWDNLVRFFSNKQIRLEWAEKSGLIVSKKNKNGFYDRFRDRIIFPIFDVNMQVIGFGGRVMDDSLPKYLNSPETAVYNKSRSLYGLNLAKQKCRETGSVFIAEGYFDLLSLHQHGIENSVATLGTSLTADHIRLLKGYADRMILVYDSDQAGIRAARRCIEIFWKEHVNFRKGDVFKKENVDTRILVLTDGHDPDSYLFEFGAEAFNNASKHAPGIISFLMESVIKKHGLSVEGKILIVSEMEETLAAIDDGVARSLYVKELAERISIDEAAVLEKVREVSIKKKDRTRRIKGSSVVSGSDFSMSGNSDECQKQTITAKGGRFERQIISMMLQFPKILPEISRRNVLEYFEDRLLKSIGQTMLNFKEDPNARAICPPSVSGDGTYVSEIMNLIDDKTARRMIAALAIKENYWDDEGCLKLIGQYEDSRKRSGNDLLRKIKEAETANDHEQLMRLLQEKQKLAIMHKELKLNVLEKK